MKFIVLTPLVFLLSACHIAKPAPEPYVFVPTKHCPDIHKPVCVTFKKDGQTFTEEHSNACYAENHVEHINATLVHLQHDICPNSSSRPMKLHKHEIIAPNPTK